MIELINKQKAIEIKNPNQESLDKIAKDSYNEGHTIGWNEGCEYAYPTGFEEGKEVGLVEGFENGFTDGKEEGLTEGFEAGKKAEYDTFWDNFQNYGKRTSYNYGFSHGFTSANFYPKYDIVVKGYNANVFYAWENGSKFSLKDRLNECGVKLDTSQATNLTDLFGYGRFTELPTVDCTGLNSNSTSLFADLYDRCTTIEKIITKESVTYDAWFRRTDITNVTFEGVIGQNLDISYGSKITHDSLMNIISCLKDYSGTTTTKTLTLHTNSKAKLTDAEKALITQKGWTLA